MSRLASTLAALCLMAAAASAQTPIKGDADVEADQMASFVQAVNPDFDPAIAHAFISEGRRLGLRGDIALCQAIVETGWFRFEGGTAVTPDQHNYCGLGVTRRGLKGHSFDSVELGVRAMMQHLWAYSTADPLPECCQVVDPRFSLVCRGSAPSWEALSNRWAMNPSYGTDILALYARLRAHAGLPDTSIALSNGDSEMPAAAENAEEAFPGIWD